LFLFVTVVCEYGVIFCNTPLFSFLFHNSSRSGLDCGGSWNSVYFICVKGFGLSEWKLMNAPWSPQNLEILKLGTWVLQSGTCWGSRHGVPNHEWGRSCPGPCDI
jgi:hypothetical protein